MERLGKWLIAVLVVAVAMAGWFGWRGSQWRQAYFADTIGQLTYDVEMAHRQLVRARDTRVYQQKVDAMATAYGYLVSAHAGGWNALERMAPSRPGRPASIPTMYVPMLLQYARDLSPEMEHQALQRRIDLLDGLARALRAGRTDRVAKPGLSFAVDTGKLKRSLEEYFNAMPQPEDGPRLLRFEDEPNKPHLTARWQGSEVKLGVDWDHTYRLFPNSAPSRLLLVRPSAEVRSDADQQERMGAGPLAPFTVEERQAELHQVIKEQLPEGWTEGTYKAIRIPEGLPQNLTLQLSGGAAPELLLVAPGSGTEAVPIPIGEP